MNCRVCKAQIAANAKFCENCGAGQADAPSTTRTMSAYQRNWPLFAAAGFVAVLVLCLLIYAHVHQGASRARGTQATGDSSPQLFGTASCSGHPDLGDYRYVNGESRAMLNHNPGNLKATLASQRQDKDGFRIFETGHEGVVAFAKYLGQYGSKVGTTTTVERIVSYMNPGKAATNGSSASKGCDLVNGDTRKPVRWAGLRWSVILDGERLKVLGRSAELDGMDHGAAWYKVRTEHGHEGYVEFAAIKCDDPAESCKCGGDLESCPESELATRGAESGIDQTDAPEPAESQKTEAQLACRRLVVQVLRAPSTAEFPFPDKVQFLGKGQFHIQTKVVSANGVGTMTTGTFDCRLLCGDHDHCKVTQFKPLYMELPGVKGRFRF
jgi:hypothetical protein